MHLAQFPRSAAVASLSSFFPHGPLAPHPSCSTAFLRCLLVALTGSDQLASQVPLLSHCILHHPPYMPLAVSLQRFSKDEFLLSMAQLLSDEPDSPPALQLVFSLRPASSGHLDSAVPVSYRNDATGISYSLDRSAIFSDSILSEFALSWLSDLSSQRYLDAAFARTFAPDLALVSA
jgi:hypothetical protein